MGEENTVSLVDIPKWKGSGIKGEIVRGQQVEYGDTWSTG